LKLNIILLTLCVRYKNAGPKPGAPQNLTITDSQETFSIVVNWAPPIDIDKVAVAYYQIQYKSPDVPQWKMLNKEKILPPSTTYSVKSKFLYIFHLLLHTIPQQINSTRYLPMCVFLPFIQNSCRLICPIQTSIHISP